MKRKQSHISERTRRCATYKSDVLRLLCTSQIARRAELTARFEKVFGIAGEVVIGVQNAAMGSRPGKLWLTYEHVGFHSSILGFTKKKVYSISDIQAVWKVDGVGLIGMQQGLNILTSTHGEVAFTMAAKAEGMYVVIDQVLTMRKEGEMSGDLLGLSIAGGGATAATKEVALAFAGLTNSTLVGPQSAGSGDDDGSGIPEGEEQMAQWL